MRRLDLSPIARALWPAFRHIVIRLGRWFARRLANKSALWLASAMTQRIVRFRKQLARSKRDAPRWRKWMKARIRIRQHAIRWLCTHAKTLTERIMQAYEALTKKLPLRGTVG